MSIVDFNEARGEKNRQWRHQKLERVSATSTIRFVSPFVWSRLRGNRMDARPDMNSKPVLSAETV
jgi:hypothetical protein